MVEKNSPAATGATASMHIVPTVAAKRILRPLGETSLNAKVAKTRFGQGFDSGPVLAIHALGPYTIIEYARDYSRIGNIDEKMAVEHGKTSFVGLHNGSAWMHADSLEAAVVHVVSYAKHHINSQLASLFMTIIDADGEGARAKASTMHGDGDRTLTTSTVHNPYDTPKNRN